MLTMSINTTATFAAYSEGDLMLNTKAICIRGKKSVCMWGTGRRKKKKGKEGREGEHGGMGREIYRKMPVKLFL